MISKVKLLLMIYNKEEQEPSLQNILATYNTNETLG